MEKIVTCTAPVNIAVIKYWGKRDEELVLPLNDSISFTLSQNEMCAKTTVMISPSFKSDRIWLNNKEESMENPRIRNCLKEVRRRASKRKHENGDTSFLSWHIHICSENNFPTAAGLASSAAGYACLVYALGQLFGVEGDLTPVARLGSGSACRSLEGGIVHWRKGEAPDGSDSIAVQIADVDHWPDLRIIICVANSDTKKTGSTEGMRRSVATSYLLKCRIRESVVKRTENLIKAVKDKDWSAFCDLVIADSNEMHAVCLDTFPPCVYMNDTSHAVADLVHTFNQIKTERNETGLKVCYTFDAGANACLFVPGGGSSVNEFASILNKWFPSTKSTNSPDGLSYWRGIPVDISTPDKLDEERLCASEAPKSHTIKYFIHTRVGEGPKVVSMKEGSDDSLHLLDRSTGLPTTSPSLLPKQRKKLEKTSENDP